MTLRETRLSSVEGMGDEGLLRAYVEEVSGEAFAELARRHVGGVYGQARRRMGDGDRAEDVTQAVFLLLARKAKGLDGGVPLVGWLYRVTRYVCANARKIDGRRRRHEAEAARMKSWEEKSLREGLDADVEGHLDRVLQELPWREREAVLMRYMQECSVGEIAAATGSTEAGVKKRLGRALARMRGGFAGLGVVVPVGFVPSVLHVVAPAHVVAASAGVGVSSAAAVAPGVVHLAQGGWTMMATAKVKVLAVVMGVLVMAGGMGTVLLAQRARVGEPEGVAKVEATMPATIAAVVEAAPQVMPAAIAVEVVKDPIVVRGRVLDPSGKPVAGAKVTVPSLAKYMEQGVHPVAQTVTGGDGRYEISFRKGDVSAFSNGQGVSAEEAWKDAQVVASAEGFGMAWSEWDKADGKGNVDLKLVADDMPIEGRILSADGKPAAGTVIVVEDLHSYLPKAFAEAQAKGTEGMKSLPAALEFPISATGGAERVVTDGEGRFRITGLGRGRWMTMELYGPMAGLGRIEVVTQDVVPFDRNYNFSGVTQMPSVRVYGSKLVVTTAAALTIEGTVRDAVTHAPVAGVKVLGDGWIMSPPMDLRTLNVMSGADGHFRIEGFPITGGFSLEAFPYGEEPYLMREFAIDAAAAESHIHLDMELHKGVWIGGKVTDKVTGKGVCVRMLYTTYVDNPHAIELPEFMRYENIGGGKMDGEEVRYQTSADGSYRVVGIPGKGIVGVQCYGETATYRRGVGAEGIKAYAGRDTMKFLYQRFPIVEFAQEIREVEVPEKGSVSDLDFQLDPGVTVHATIVDGEGKPVGECVVNHSRMAGNYDVVGPLVTGGFNITGLSPQEDRMIIVGNMERKIGKIFPFVTEDGKGGVIVIKLEPMGEISGHCDDPQGNAAAGVPIEVESSGTLVGSATTDANGDFHCLVIAGGVNYFASVASGIYLGSSIARDFTVEAGEKQELGTVRLKKSRQKF